jgi:hypothetical protein
MIPGASPIGVYAIGQITGGLGTASGVLLTSTASLIAGTALGGANAQAAIMVSAASLIEGHAIAGAIATGALLQAISSIDAGQAAGSADAVGETLDIAVTLIAGDAIGAGAGVAPGSTIVVQTGLTPGLASGQIGTIRVAGGSAFTRSRHTALGAVLTTATSIIPGVVQIGHEITIVELDGSSHVLTIFGATDEELRDDNFIMGAVTGDWDLYLFNQQWEEAA